MKKTDKKDNKYRTDLQNQNANVYVDRHGVHPHYARRQDTNSNVIVVTYYETRTRAT